MTDQRAAITTEADPSAAPSPRTSSGLLRVLGVTFGLAILVGNTIGMGILRTPGEVAAQVPSAPLYMLVWVVGALYALLGALTIAELSAMHPRSGGLYPLVHRALGPYFGFVSGWTDWIATCCSMAAVAMVLAEYVQPLWPALQGAEVLTASIVIISFALLQWRGIRLGGGVQQITSLLKAIALIGLALVVFAFGRGSGATAPVNALAPSLPGGLALAGAVVIALQSVIFTYDGWTAPIYFAGEVRNPARDIPRSMIGGVLLVLAIYFALNLAFLQVVPIEDMAGDPFVAATVAARMFGPDGDTALRGLMVVSLIAAAFASLLMASRVPYAMSCDGLFPAIFRRVNAGGTPVPALLVGTALGLGFISTNTFGSVLALLAFFFVANYVLAFASLFVMRWREPNAPRPFRVPGYPWVPGLALLVSLIFLFAAIVGDRSNSLIALLVLGLSLPAYGIMRWLKRPEAHS